VPQISAFKIGLIPCILLYLHFRFLFHGVDCVWNVMAHEQKPDFVFRRNGQVHLNRRGASVQSTTGSRGVRISGSNAGYTMFRGNVKSTDYPLYSPVSPSLPLPCFTVCHHILSGLYLWCNGLSLNISLYGFWYWSRRDSNPQSQQESGHRTTSYTARLLESVFGR